MAIYLDNAATSYPKPAQVADTVYRFMTDNGANAGRGAYAKARAAGATVDETRHLICRLFNHPRTEDVVFTTNVTEALNLAIRGIVKPGGHVITSKIEHNAVWRCLKTLERDQAIRISTLPCGFDGTIDVTSLAQLAIANTDLIVVNHASNVLGTIQPISEIGAFARSKQIPFLVDSAQTAGCISIDMVADNIDLLAFTGHKGLLGPMGTGGLVINSKLVICPLKVGGTGRDSLSEYQPQYLPDRLEAGTLNVSGIAGLGAAIQYILDETVEKIRDRECQLIAYTLNQLSAVNGITIYGPGIPEKMIGVISFNLAGINAIEVEHVLDEVYDIMLRAGLHCAPCAHRLIGTEQVGTLRIGLGYFNSQHDVNELVQALREIQAKLA